jgi:hypothetical protein
MQSVAQNQRYSAPFWVLARDVDLSQRTPPRRLLAEMPERRWRLFRRPLAHCRPLVDRGASRRQSSQPN